MLGQNEQLEVYQDRFRYLYIMIVGMAVLLVFRLWYLQVLQGDRFKRISEENRLKKIRVEAPRGMIFDRNRTLLIDNQPTFSLTITPQYFRPAPKDKREETLKKISEITSIKVSQIRKTLKKARRQQRFQPVVIKKNLSQDEVALVEMEKLELPGVDVLVGIQRKNVSVNIGSQILGYISKINPKELPRLNSSGRKYTQDDSIGKSGLEQQWENILRGSHGIEYFEVDAYGRKKRTLTRQQEQGKENIEAGLFGDLKAKPEIPGKNLVLTIDQDLQKAAAEAFGEEKTGALVALDPNNGEILSMLSWPSFNSTEFSIGISPKSWKSLITNENKPLRNKAIQDHYNPGSVFKIISALAALEEGYLTENTIVNAGGVFRFGGRPYHEWKRGGFQKTNVVKALTQSVNVFFYKLATRMDVDVLAEYGKNFGLGARTKINMPGEIPGIMPSRAWKQKKMGQEWFPGETLSVIIGQSYLTATPIQLANLIAAIANDGILYKPRIIKYVENPSGEVISSTKPEIIRSMKFSESNLDIIKRGLIGVVHGKHGTARGSKIPGITVAGKTGTSEVIRFSADKIYGDCKKLERKFRHHGWFVAFAPVEDPKIAVAAIAEHSCSGSGGAAPIVMKVIQAYLSKIMPDKYGPEMLKKARNEYWKKIARERKLKERAKVKKQNIEKKEI